LPLPPCFQKKIREPDLGSQSVAYAKNRSATVSPWDSSEMNLGGASLASFSSVESVRVREFDVVTMFMMMPDEDQRTMGPGANHSEASSRPRTQEIQHLLGQPSLRRLRGTTNK